MASPIAVDATTTETAQLRQLQREVLARRHRERRRWPPRDASRPGVGRAV